MKKIQIIAIVLILALLSSWLEREFARGTFDPVERRYAGWLAANIGAGKPLPPLVVVLYDEAASVLAGAPRMDVLDGALFARAAARCGAIAAGVEGLPGNPVRMIEAAGRMPVFGGFNVSVPPENGWTPCPGATDESWVELPGLAGPVAVRFPRGFFLPSAGTAGPRHISLVARNSGQPVPSFLAMAWAAGMGIRPSVLHAMPGRLEGVGRFLPLDAKGGVRFFQEAAPRVMTMNELLVAAEKFERDGGVSPLRGCVLVLCRATSDVERIRAADGGEVFTPAELWAQAWQALQRGRAFVLPGPWYPVLVVLVGLSLGAGPGRREWLAVLLTGAAVFLVFLLVALGAFATYGVLLPLVPSMATILLGLLSGRLWARSKRSVVP